MPVQHTFQPLPDLRYRLVHTAAQRLLDLLQLRLQSFPHRLPSDLAMALSGGSTTVRKPQKRETLRLPFSPRPALPCGVWSELDQPRLLRMQFQARTLPAVPQTPSGTVRPRRGARTPPPDRPRSEWPSLCPSPPFPAIPRSIDRKRDVGTRWRAAVKLLPLWCPYRRLRPLAVFAYPRFQPFLDQAVNSLVGDSVLDETHRPFVTHVVKESPHPRSSSLPSVRSPRSARPMPPETSGDPCGLRPGRNP